MAATMMDRRAFLLGSAAGTAALWAAPGLAQDDLWGRSQNFPTGFGPPGQPPNFEGYTQYRAGNYSGGFEKMFPFHRIAAPPAASPLQLDLREGLRASSGQSLEEYMKAWPVTGFLVARKGRILVERHGFERKPDMRMTSWSMAKSVTSLLLGLCLDKGLIESLDDLPEKYVESLKGTVHGQTSLRHLANMSSGAQVLHNRDNSTIYPRAFLSRASDLEPVVREWNWRQEPAGARFNYNELCPLTIGMVIRQVTGRSMADLCAEQLWQPMGAEAEATWLTDTKKKEFNCIGFGARLRDWARLGQLVAQNGAMGGKQIVSAQWINECATWSAKDVQVRSGGAGTGMGYKCFFWHPRSDGSWMMMLGHHGQVVLVDRKSETVLAHTALEHKGDWRRDLFALFAAATAWG